MITRRTYNDMESRNGFQIAGSISTNSSGVGTFTIKGKDYSSKITGITLTCANSTASAVKMYSAYVVSIAYSSATKLTTVTIQANQIIDSGTGTTDLSAYQGTVYYTAWVDESKLPTDLSTNDTTKQEY